MTLPSLPRAAWGKANEVFNDEIIFLSDSGAAFSKSIGWSNGPQTARYAIALDKGKVIYAGKDERGQFDVSVLYRLRQVIAGDNLQF